MNELFRGEVVKKTHTKDSCVITIHHSDCGIYETFFQRDSSLWDAAKTMSDAERQHSEILQTATNGVMK